MLYERLVELRKERKMTQEELANVLGISRSALSLYETDKRQPDFQTICRLADFFNVSVDYLLGRTDDRCGVARTTYKAGNKADFILRDPDIREALDELDYITADEKESLLTHLYGIKSKRQRARDDK
ncbi:helix-turn-helix domain-containing protein [Mahella australiensis]|uniref:Helix-turn-helix domain protein n=1 Tax=Mahella australiensis (strain DSM 15567 / CIP 107919 / 50-1 BON) TaxID=697281 RepID=F4A093_MAHA5|nr:helix-turn-helix transcriptional regulator [Mahella australiensis]AEE96927.1 helix-turn-helix domain protein [Mahella australiensis 50-1 BON]